MKAEIQSNLESSHIDNPMVLKQLIFHKSARTYILGKAHYHRIAQQVSRLVLLRILPQSHLIDRKIRDLVEKILYFLILVL